MIRILCVLTIAGMVVLIAAGAITLYDETLQAGRMWETPAVKPHERPIPLMDPESIPVTAAGIVYRNADPDALVSPLDGSDPQIRTGGKIGYQRYCVHCHGPNHDGYGTVGQSFVPVPGDLRSARIQNMSAGRIFHEISYGIPGGRQPALAATIDAEERWRITAFIKSLGVRP